MSEQDGYDKVTPLLAALKKDKTFMARISRWTVLPAREGRYEDLPPTVPEALVRALEARGIHRLYSHQKTCYDHARAGRNYVVVTPTASGKSLCYHLPVLQGLLERRDARALYLFPTKALSQDQQAEMNALLEGGRFGPLDGGLGLPSGGLQVSTYDGDTPDSVRIAAREKGRIIITNPDMLHTGILPNHTRWIRFFKNIAYVVIDEIHSYGGVLGAHMTNLIRRFKRIAAFYGSRPVFIACSATIGNPKELAEKIIEAPVELVDENGAPSGEKHILFYNPPLVDKVQGIRRGVVLEAQDVALRLLKHGLKTIVFARSRVRTELIAGYINEGLANVFTDNARIRVEAYRGGYLPNERRAIEKGLRDGSIQGIVSTNALELGIDIGGLDAAVLAGLPPSVSSSWQQAGRSGRRQTVSLAVFIASANPYDQFMMNHPDYFFSRRPESAFLDPDNLVIRLDHLKCSVFELPFHMGERFPEPVDELLGHLEEGGVVRLAENNWYWADRGYPAEGISLRSADPGNVVIVDVTKGANAVIGEMDRRSARELVFDEAIYIHRGTQYVVEKLDLENLKCLVSRTDVNYYTDSITKRDIKVLYQDRVEELPGLKLVLGDILVRSAVTKYKKLRYHTHENVGYGDIHLPEDEMHTRSLMIVFSDKGAAGSFLGNCAETDLARMLGGLGYLLKNIIPLYLLCSPGDFGISERVRDPYYEAPALYIFDHVPGGVGLAEGVRDVLFDVLDAARSRIAECGCRDGCPSCIGPLQEAPEGCADPADVKEAAIGLLALLLGAKAAGEDDAAAADTDDPAAGEDDAAAGENDAAPDAAE